ncbi:NTP transferase domain-containing protein [uncultured Friedmanniella sp.]|uniref:nucleotidyltransferase family protein n=1 Tax=uncultured Friedmanniella sp. TaxID=335381 RepID=UPI0035CAF041
MAAVTGVLLAAGAGRRAGGPKSLRRDTDGTSWLARSIAVLVDGGCDDVLVVLGCEAEAARRLLAEPAVRVAVRVAVGIAENPSWAEGMGSSLAVGLQSVGAGPGRAALVHLVDLPDVSAAVVARVLDRPLTPDTLARATYDGRPGHPVLVGAAHLAPLVASLGGDRGGQAYLRISGAREVECADLATGHDDDHAPGLAG